MSSILKALRKIEKEKRVTQHAAPDLRIDQGQAPARSRQYLPLLAGVALGAIVVGLFSFWSSRDATLVVNGDTETSKPVSVVVAPTIMPDTLNVTTTDSEVSLPSVPEAALSQNEIVALQPAARPEGNLRKEGLTVVNPALQVDLPLDDVIVPSSVVSTVLPEGVSLFVSEIFYQENASDSMAVVNDLPVMVGTHVDSAVVDEIRQKQVLFRIAEKLYLVGISSI